jgi:16S rRNA processing protein RimM
MDTYILVGKIGTTYGVQGWLKIHTYTEFGASILEYRPWYLEYKDKGWTPIEIESSRLHNNGIIIKFSHINTPEEARLLTGINIGITRSQLPALNENEYYWSDLVGLTVINKNGEILGKVAYLIATGSNDVLVVKGEKEHAIPFLQGSVITRIDLNQQSIWVDWEFQ